MQDVKRMKLLVIFVKCKQIRINLVKEHELIDAKKRFGRSTCQQIQY